MVRLCPHCTEHFQNLCSGILRQTGAAGNTAESLSLDFFGGGMFVEAGASGISLILAVATRESAGSTEFE
ncbi:MAG TPA: hypothetical protein DIT89_03205 [Planctomycetaceae bacterium]|nr:hypothetical protein [Planctomycetaceae bacterium]